MPTARPLCPLCDRCLGPYDLPISARADEEFRLADHLLVAHLRWKYGREVNCWCGLVMSAKVEVLMAHLKDKGGAAEHYRAWQLGID